VTTVDVRIQRVDGEKPLYLHNGMFGPATSVFSAVVESCRDGRGDGRWTGPAAFEATMAGRDLRAVLTAVGVEDSASTPAETKGQLEGYLGRLEDDAKYRVTALEH
jgi:hypothetical protein